QCFSIPANDSKVCSGNGVCVAPDNCTCSTGYSGNDCSTENLQRDENPEFNTSWLWFLLLLIIPVIAVVALVAVVIVYKMRKKKPKPVKKQVYTNPDGNQSEMVEIPL